MKSFLVVYDQAAGRLLELLEFDEQEHAMTARLERELANVTNPSIEVVVLNAGSQDALRRTHARYFSSVSDLANAAG